MNFEDIHGKDHDFYVFMANGDNKYRSFAYRGYGANAKERARADRFQHLLDLLKIRYNMIVSQF